MFIPQKKALREVMKEKRAQLSLQFPQIGETIATLFFNSFKFSPQTIIGAYWPLEGELDTRPLLMRLQEKGHSCALPCTTPEGMLFRLWESSMMLTKGKFQILEPPATSLEAIPHVLLVPLLAFDENGHRLGYGQGHYDHYLYHHKTLTIGLGFKAQQVIEIPYQSHDLPLDFILTEEGVLKTRKSVESSLDF